MAKKIGDKSCQSNFDKRLSDFGSVYYCIHDKVRIKIEVCNFALKLRIMKISKIL